MKSVKGDLVKMFMNGEFDIIIQGCNCQKMMGAGIAYQIKREIPEAYLADQLYDRFEHNIDKLSNYSYATVRREGHPIGFVINLYSQFLPGKNLDENAILLGFTKLSKKLLSKLNNKDTKIGIPEIGCGIAGGDWNIIGPKIAEIMKNYNLTHVKYDSGK